MNIAVPVPQQSPGPDWAQDIYTALFSVIDQHNHSTGNGVQITPAGLNINSPLTFGSNNATNMLAAGFTSQASPLAIATYPAAVYVSGGNLYYNSSSTQIQLTTPTGVNATSSGISSGTATASFVSSVLVVNEAANTPANIQAGSYLLGNNVAGSNFITLAPTTTIPSNYTLSLPVAPPSATSFLTMNSSGTVAATIPSAANIVFTGSTGTNTTASTSFIEVNSVAITTSGGPVTIANEADGSSSGGQFNLTNNTGTAQVVGWSWQFSVGATFGSSTPIATGSLTTYLPNGVTGAFSPNLSYTHLPSVGSYTYYLAVKCGISFLSLETAFTKLVISESV
jgi:hypothetical protein